MLNGRTSEKALNKIKQVIPTFINTDSSVKIKDEPGQSLTTSMGVMGVQKHVH